MNMLWSLVSWKPLVAPPLPVPKKSDAITMRLFCRICGRKWEEELVGINSHKIDRLVRGARNLFYVDSVYGDTIANGADGSRARPFSTVQGQLLTRSKATLKRTSLTFSRPPHCHIADGGCGKLGSTVERWH